MNRVIGYLALLLAVVLLVACVTGPGFDLIGRVLDATVTRP